MAKTPSPPPQLYEEQAEMVRHLQRTLGWEVYALDACQCIIDASLYWTGIDEKKNPLLKRARTMAGEALRLEKESHE